jgi:hypothetical protein
MITLTKAKKKSITCKGNMNDKKQRRKLIFLKFLPRIVHCEYVAHRCVIILLCIICITFVLDPGFILLIGMVISNFTILCTIHFFGYRQGSVYKEYGYITRPTRAQGHYYFSVTRKLGQFWIVVFIEYINV